MPDPWPGDCGRIGTGFMKRPNRPEDSQNQIKAQIRAEGHGPLQLSDSDPVLTANEPQGDTGDRIIQICEAITPLLANQAILKLLTYESNSPGRPVHMHIFSPGGCVASGLAIVDVMAHISAPVFTYCIGYAASMGAVLLACGQPQHRYILPHSRVMIHQPNGFAGGTLENLRSTLTYQSALESELEILLARATGKTRRLIRDASRVDNWLDARRAKDFGLVDHILPVAPDKIPANPNNKKHHL